MYRIKLRQLTFIILFNWLLNTVPSFNGDVLNADVLADRKFDQETLNPDIYKTHKIIRRFVPRTHYVIPLPHPHLPPLPMPRPGVPFPMFEGNPKGDEESFPFPYGDEPEDIPGSDESAEDRTLIAAKKALLIKKAILAKKAIIAKAIAKKVIVKKAIAKKIILKKAIVKKAILKKKKKKYRKKLAVAGLAAYGLNKLKGSKITFKTPMIKVNIGPNEEEEADEENAADDTGTNTKGKNTKNSKGTTTSNTTTQNPVQDSEQQVDENVQSDATSKKAKKKGKKKGKKPKPRPVNLGVKANLYKKFDQLAKNAQDKLSSYIQIDIDFDRGRAALDDVIKPGTFYSRSTYDTDTPSKISRESDKIHDEYMKGVQIPGNFIPAWSKPNWSNSYPQRKHTQVDHGESVCCLKPVYLFYKNEPKHTSVDDKFITT